MIFIPEMQQGAVVRTTAPKISHINFKARIKIQVEQAIAQIRSAETENKFPVAADGPVYFNLGAHAHPGAGMQTLVAHMGRCV